MIMRKVRHTCAPCGRQRSSRSRKRAAARVAPRLRKRCRAIARTCGATNPRRRCGDVAVEKAAASRIELDQHIGGAGRDVNVQNSVVTTLGKKILPFDPWCSKARSTFRTKSRRRRREDKAGGLLLERSRKRDPHRGRRRRWRRRLLQHARQGRPHLRPAEYRSQLAPCYHRAGFCPGLGVLVQRMNLGRPVKISAPTIPRAALPKLCA